MTCTVSCVGLDQPTIVDMSSGNTAVNFSGLTIPVVTHVSLSRDSQPFVYAPDRYIVLCSSLYISILIPLFLCTCFLGLTSISSHRHSSLKGAGVPAPLSPMLAIAENGHGNQRKHHTNSTE